MRIYLLGFMGVGKSYWGDIWAKELAISFMDLDRWIEYQTGMLVEDIFKKKSENYFRIREAEILRETARENNCIIATGGGAPCFNNNMEWMNRYGITILLEASPAYLLNRLRNDDAVRPLLKNLNESEIGYYIEKKLEERMPFYSQAQFRLSCEGLSKNTLRELLPIFK